GQGLPALRIPQRRIVVVPCHMQVPVSVYGHTYGIVSIGYVALKPGFPHCPYCIRKLPRAENQKSIFIIVSCKLPPLMTDQGVFPEYYRIYRIVSPSPSHDGLPHVLGNGHGKKKEGTDCTDHFLSAPLFPPV